MKLRLVDAIISWEPCRSIRGVKAASFEEYMLREPLGYGAQIPESLLLGSAVHLAAWLTILSSEFTQMALVEEVDAVRFHGPVGPGQRVVFDLVARTDTSSGTVLDGQGHVEDRLVIEVSGVHTKSCPLADYHDPQDLRVLFSEIHRSVAGVAR